MLLVFPPYRDLKDFKATLGFLNTLKKNHLNRILHSRSVTKCWTMVCHKGNNKCPSYIKIQACIWSFWNTYWQTRRWNFEDFSSTFRYNDASIYVLNVAKSLRRQRRWNSVGGSDFLLILLFQSTNFNPFNMDAFATGM